MYGLPSEQEFAEEERQERETRRDLALENEERHLLNENVEPFSDLVPANLDKPGGR